MNRRLLRPAARAFDWLEPRWDALATQRRLAGALIAVYLVGLAVIEAERRGWLGGAVSQAVPSSHFEALSLTFTLLLLVEVIGLVLGLVRSVAAAVGKQFEILSLILLRNSFKELAGLDEPIGWDQAASAVTDILSDAGGALLIFASLVLYSRLQRHAPITRDADDRASFIAAKKLIAILLLAALPVIGVAAVDSGRSSTFFFEAFYTLLIFADVLIVLISMRYSTAYPVVFRYFGFAVATVLVRLALTAPPPFNAALGLGATLFAVALTWVYNRAVAIHEGEETGNGAD